jgi:hypothetical protein
MTERKNALVTIITNPQSGLPLTMRLVVVGTVTKGAPIQAGLIASGGTGGYVFSEVGTALVTDGFTLTNVVIGGQNIGQITGTAAIVGRMSFVAQVADSSSTVTTMTFTIDVVSRLAVVAGTPLPGEIGVPYSYTIIVSGATGTLTWTLPTGTLPAGVTRLGYILGGVPTGTAGFSYFTIHVVDSGTGDALDIPCSMQVVPALAIVPLVPDALINQPYAGSFTVTGGYVLPGVAAIKFSATGLPAGMILNGNGTFSQSGLPTTPSLPNTPSSVVVTATDALGGSATATVNISVVRAPRALPAGQIMTGALDGSGGLVGVNFLGPFTARLATTAALPANTYYNGPANDGVGATLTMTATGFFNVDNVIPVLNDLVLVKDETAITPANNGLYLCTVAPATGVAGVFTRSANMDSAAKYMGALVVVSTGLVNQLSMWQCWSLTVPPIVGTSGFRFYKIPIGMGTAAQYFDGTGSLVAFGSFANSPTAITPSGSPYTYQNLSGHDADVLTTGGTVSVIAFSRDGTTYYAAGITAGSQRLSPLDRIRVIYTVAPTMTLIPR